MAQPQANLFEAVRRACAPATWSRGVELTRADAVVGERAAAEELVFRVTTRGGMICPRVRLFLDDLEWDCECASRESVCEHVAAAVIAWRRSREEGRELPVPRTGAGRVGYRFRRAAGSLALERVIVRDGEERSLDTTLAALADGRVAGPRFMATQADLAVELVLGTHRRGPIPANLLPRVLAALAGESDLTLDGRPVRVAVDPVLPRARVEDSGDGFFVVVEPDPAVTERFANGAVLCGEVLRHAGDSRLTARERHELGRGRHFPPDAVPELVTEVLPALSRRLPVLVRTDRLPRTAQVKPRIVLDCGRAGEVLWVLATLVYGDPPMARIDGGRLVHLRGEVPLRDLPAERRELRRLAGLGLACGVRAELRGVDAVAFRSRLRGWEGEIRGAGGLDAFRLVPPLEPRVEVDGARVAVWFECGEGTEGAARGPGGGGRAEAAAVLRAWRAGESLVALASGGFAPLPEDWLARFGHRVAALLAARGAEGAVPRCCWPDLARLCDELDRARPPELAGLSRLLDAGFQGIPPARLPDDLRTTLRPYQKAGVDWLVFLREAGLGALLADDMGLGKTLQALCALGGRTLVVAPTSVLHSWVQELRAHRPGLSCCVYHGPRRAFDEAADVTVTTYALLRLDADALAARSWDTVVLDEAQNIKNPESLVATAAYRLNGAFRIALTGTPVENRLDELWSQFHFINRGLLGGRQDFQEQLVEPIARGDADAAARLRERIRPFLLRRMKREVASELPPRTDMLLHCELSEAERQVYDAVRAATLAEVAARLGEGGGVMAALEALLRLRQAACHPGLIPGQSAASSAKLALLMEALDSVVAEGHKALVFSQWTSLLDLVEPHLRAAPVDFVRLDGSTRDREAVVRRFQEDAAIPLMLVSLKAGGTGLNLTAADHIFLLDPWWNPAVEDQAADRAHRIGQRRPVMVYRLIAIDTVEERILALQQRKRALADAALAGAGQAAGLTREDLMELLA
jgi:superfamily II DNA or RNA helicase